MYDGWNVLGERREGSDDFVSYYTRGADMGGGIGGIISVHRNGTPAIYPNGYHTGDYFYHYNHRGDVVSVTDSSGSEVAHYRYDAFGNVKQKTGTFESPYQFSTKEYDDVSGLSYYGFRYYSPELGVWLSKDPLGYVSGMSLYNFIFNNPLNMTDPFGLQHNNLIPIPMSGSPPGWHDPIQVPSSSAYPVSGTGSAIVDIPDALARHLELLNMGGLLDKPQTMYEKIWQEHPDLYKNFQGFGDIKEYPEWKNGPPDPCR